jgi:hypothetical protein
LGEPRGHEEAHLIERISMSFNVFNCMVDNAPNLTRFKVQGDLPELRVNFSDRKYNIVMSMIDVALPNFKDESEAEKASENDKHKETAFKAPINQNKLARKPKKQSFRMPAFFSHEASLTYDLGEEERPPHHVREVTNPGEDDEFFEAPDLSQAEQVLLYPLLSVTSTTVWLKRLPQHKSLLILGKITFNSSLLSENSLSQSRKLTPKAAKSQDLLIQFWKDSTSV